MEGTLAQYLKINQWNVLYQWANEEKLHDYINRCRVCVWGGEICQNSTLVHDFKKKQLRKITIERNCFHLIKGKTPSVDILLNDKRMDAFPLRLRTR